MLREERLQFILDRLEKDQRVFSTGLIEELNVSEGTIRRDLNELQEKGLLKKVHGGAVPRPLVPQPEAPRVFAGRKEYASESKSKIAAKAINLLKDGQLIIMDGGTSNWHIAKLIPRDIKLTIFTNSIPISNELMDHHNIDMYLFGGKVVKGQQVTVDAGITDVLNEIHADIAFIGIRSIHPKIGLTTLQHEEARIKKMMILACEKVAVLVTKDKLNTADQYKICDTGDLDILIVEEGINPEELMPYKKLGIEII